jgi:hypothetical protein
MGSTFGDFDGDGDLDWFVTSIHDPAETCELHPCNWSYSGNRLYRNEGGRAFSDATDAAGVRAGYWGWGAAFFDWENDADLDLVMTNGVEFPKELWEDAFNTDPMRLWRNDGTGNMVEVSAGEGITDTRSGKGLLVFDYDSDGDLDLFVVNNAAGPTLYRNEQAPGNAWLRLRVRGSISNRDGIGSQVRVWRSLPGPPQVREVGAASHFVGQSEPELHFGLGAGIATVARIEVFFPASGVTVVRRDVVVNQTITIEEPSAAVPGPGLGLSIGLAGLLLACGRSAVQLVKAGRADARRDLR